MIGFPVEPPAKRASLRREVGHDLVEMTHGVVSRDREPTTVRQRADWAIGIITAASTWEEIEDHDSYRGVGDALRAFAKTVRRKSKDKNPSASRSFMAQLHEVTQAAEKMNRLKQEYRDKLGLPPR